MGRASQTSFRDMFIIPKFHVDGNDVDDDENSRVDWGSLLAGRLDRTAQRGPFPFFSERRRALGTEFQEHKSLSTREARMIQLIYIIKDDMNTSRLQRYKSMDFILLVVMKRHQCRKKPPLYNFVLGADEQVMSNDDGPNFHMPRR